MLFYKSCLLFYKSRRGFTFIMYTLGGGDGGGDQACYTFSLSITHKKVMGYF